MCVQEIDFQVLTILLMTQIGIKYSSNLWIDVNGGNEQRTK